MLLFDDKVRTLEGPSPYNADIYRYYNDSAREDVGIVRNLLESWFKTYPEEHKDDFKAGFKAAMAPGFYELYIYTLFTALGYDLEVHPELPGTAKRPDFKATKNKDYFYIEVKYLTMSSAIEKNAERKKNAVLDAIDKIDASNFLLMLEEIIFKDISQPSGKSIIRFFNQELSKYNPDDYTALLEKHGFDGMPAIIYDDEKITIKTKLLPKSSKYRGTNSRSIALHPSVAVWGNDSDDIKSALEAKAVRYGKFNAPFIICLNKQNVGLDKIEVNEALHGKLRISWSTNPLNRDERWEYDGTGLFGSKVNPKFTRLSAVYITNANDANLAMNADHVLTHNPFAQFPLELSIGKKIKELLNIPDDYPGRKLPDLNWGL